MKINMEFTVANLKQSKKRARQDLKKRLINKRNLSIIRTHIKKFLNLINLAQFDVAVKIYPSLVSIIDKGVAKGVFHKNRASRLKSRLNNRLRIK